VVKLTFLAVSVAATLGIAAVPPQAVTFATTGSEAFSAFATGAVLLLLAAAAKRVPRKQ
jgi:hypothetical protein